MFRSHGKGNIGKKVIITKRITACKLLCVGEGRAKRDNGQQDTEVIMTSQLKLARADKKLSAT